MDLSKPQDEPEHHDHQQPNCDHPPPPLPLLLPAPPEKPPSPPSAAAATTSRLSVVSKVDGFVAGGSGAAETREVGANGSGDVERILRRDRRVVTLRRAALVLRAAAGVLSLIAFSVMASDKTQGWAGDSFDRYREYKYLVAVNVIIFVYSGFQVYDHMQLIMIKRRIIRRPLGCYLDLSMDQLLAYLSMSASSSAAARNRDWVATFGSDDFTKKADGSIAMSFLTFFALAASSVVSARNVFSRAL